ncbi:MAG: hypothetical protein DMG32_17195 [Acidobacteria bacterium]|nr:MAG: hypothetical protein DMG32_17195 [Acidobacteriota bacterium]
MSPAYQSPNWTQVQRIERSRSNARMDVISRPFFGASPRLARVMEVEEAPWLAGALEELRALKAAGRDVPGLGDFRIAEETMDRARQLLTLEPLRRLAAPSVVPFSGGGLALSWNAKGRDLTLSIYPSEREITYARTSQDDVVLEDGVIAEEAELGKIVDRYLSSFI